MKKILVPVDFSEYSEYALETAAILAKKYNVGIVVMHMIGLSEAVLTKDESQEMYEANYYMKLAKRKFDTFLDQDYLKGIALEMTVQNYKRFHEIDDVANDFNASLIIMGSHGATGFKEIFVGSNTEKVVRTSRVPVLVIKKKPSKFKLDKVVFACDFNLDFIESFKRASNFFKELNVQFQVVYINLPDDRFMSTQEMKEKALKFFIHTGIDEFEEAHEDVVFYSAYSLESGIFEFSNEIKADVIAIPTHGRRGLVHFFSEHIGTALVNHSDMPMMTFKV